MRASRRSGLLVLGAFFALTSLLYAGPDVFRLDRVCVPTCGSDPSLYVWMFRWMAQAVTTGHDPFVTPLIGSPSATPLHWITSVSTPALAGVPLTLLLGARASYNLMVILGVALAAWSAYLLCVEVSGRTWASIAGGAVFLLSSYMTYELFHMNLLLVAPVILSARLAIRFAKGSMSTLRFAMLGGLLLLAELFTSTEVFATASFFAAIAYALHLALTPTARPDAWKFIRGVAGAYGVCLVLAAPYLVSAFGAQPQAVWVPLTVRSVDLPEFVVPSEVSLLGAWTGHLRRVLGVEPGYPDSGIQGYFGIPVLLLVGALWRDRSKYPAMLPPFISAVAVASLGPKIEVFRHLRIPGPYLPFSQLPLLEHAFPKRFPLYAWIGISVALALWVAGRSEEDRRRTILWLLIGGLVLLPGPQVLAPPQPVAVAASSPEFFTTGQHRWFLERDDVVVALAHLGQELEWQVAADLEFRLAEGYLGPYAPWGLHPLRSSPAPSSVARLRGLMELKQVDWVILPTGARSPWRSLLLEAYGEFPISVGGIDLYRVGTDGPGPTDPAPSPAAQAAFRRGVDAVAQGFLTDAAAEFRQVLALRPTNRFAHHELAKIYLAYGDERLAEVHLRAALVENRDFVAPLVDLARLWTATRRTAAADALYRRIFLLRPSALTDEERAHVDELLASVQQGDPMATP